MLLLSQDSGGQILIWPEFTWAPVINGIIFLAVLFTVIYYIQKAIRNRNQSTVLYRDKVLAKLHLHEFHNKEVNLFHEFLDQVPYGELKKIAEDPSWYEKYFLSEFLQFLANHSNLPAWKDVLIVQTLDNLIKDHGPHPKKYIPAILQTDSEEYYPILLGAHEITEGFVNKGIHARIYSKKGDHSFALTRYEKFHLLFRTENKQWLRFDAILLSHQDTNLTLQIKTAPELDEKRTKEWVEVSKGSPAGPKDPGVIPEEYKDSLAQILEYSGLNQNICEQIKNLVQAYKEHPGLIRRQHRQEDYQVLIRLYKVCFIKFRSQTANVPKPILLFMHFFFLDETLLSEKRIRDLETSILTFKLNPAESTNSGVKLSIHLFPDWLNLVLAGKKHPSKNQMGQTYDQVEKSKLLWNQDQETKDIRDKEYLLHLLDWELDSLLYMGLLGISLNPNLAYPILSEDQFYGETESNLLYPRKILSNAAHVLKIDPGLFYREVRSGSSAEIHQQEVIRKEFFADCILLPFAGNRGVLWQETSDGNLALSRLLFPTVLNENTTLIITKTLGEFRWETERTFRGRKWKDPLPSTLTSEYFGYLENFRKNPNLTVEAKKRVEQQWIKVRQNIKDMFSIDYAYWVLLEAAGKPRLNRVVREILAHFVPIQVDTESKKQ